jgi:hypothetical protein
MTKLMNLACLGLALMTAATAAAQFANGNGDAATFSTVDSEIDSWWGLGIRSSCCNSYSGYGVVFATRSGSIYTQGSIGVGTASPQAMLTVGSLAPGASEATNKGLIQIEGNADINSGTNGIEFKASASGSGYGWKVFSPDRLNVNTPLVFAYRAGNASWTELVTMRTDTGNVGIGTTSPWAKLEVNGNVKLTTGSGASITFPDNTIQSTAWTGSLCGGDYAESVDVSGDRSHYEPGDVLVIDPSAPGKFLKSADAYSTAVAGIYSTKPGVRGRRQTTDPSHMKDEVPMAMVGVVPTKVTAESGPIKPGDLLVTSSQLGYAMKGTDRNQLTGAIVGKAMGNLDFGTGVIEVLVSLQ